MSGPLPAPSLGVAGPAVPQMSAVEDKASEERRDRRITGTRAGAGSLGELYALRRRGAHSMLGRWPRILRNELRQPEPGAARGLGVLFFPS